MPPHSPFIYDRAEEVPDTEMNDSASEGRSDSEEARVRREDRELFKMPEILATHEARLREEGPYRIPTLLLPSGAATPARHEDQLEDMPSRAPSPTIPLFPPVQMPGSRAPTPDCVPFHETDPRPHSFTPSMDQMRQRTPLFFPDPDSRGPTPFSQRGDSQAPTPAIPQLRLQTPLFHDRTPDTDPDTEREDDERAFAFLDLDAELSGADEDSDDPNEDEETLSDKEFLDDEPIHDVVPASSFRRVADDPDEGDELRAIARHYDDEAARNLAVPQQARPAAAAAPRPPMPLAAGAWIRYRRELSFVVSSRELLQVKKTGRRLKRVILKTELTDEKHRPVIPIRDHTERFRAADPHPSMAKATFGLCPALAAGDRHLIRPV
ncbi:hypothetical protein C8F04DRAFT_1264546 [Mycena alexandri]|uniref:Uncharacterized protein n=1 Tax=Mycena alexandri TaxID=1745969 RepID=A0AAD6SLT6_9AGAR|nr:hypothetical protein C8F04DRAFT_1264546 [Mycena alexandri]